MDQKPMARLPAFLVAAKRSTYAGLDEDATVSKPIIAGSKQLEYSDVDLNYRDIYFGMTYFVGQEVVTEKVNQRAIWSMSYTGGISSDIPDRERFLAIYAFLRRALLRVDEARPFRGPLHISKKVTTATSAHRREKSPVFTAPRKSICWERRFIPCVMAAALFGRLGVLRAT